MTFVSKVYLFDYLFNGVSLFPGFSLFNGLFDIAPIWMQMSAISDIANQRHE